MSVRAFMSAALMIAIGGPVSAQMVVHVLSGQVKAINPAAKTVEISTDNGTNAFSIADSSKASLDFDKDLREGTVAADVFSHVGDYALVYYYGYDTNRTAVAMKDLGAGPFLSMQGTVVGFDKKDRVMTIKAASGKTQSVTLADNLVLDNDMGVDSGRKYEPHKGSQLLVTYSQAGGKSTAVFVQELNS